MQASEFIDAIMRGHDDNARRNKRSSKFTLSEKIFTLCTFMPDESQVCMCFKMPICFFYAKNRKENLSYC